MTIFYCGKVNVYDGVSPDKVGNVSSSCIPGHKSNKVSPSSATVFGILQARAIMQLAASPVHFTQDDPLHGNASVWSSPCHLPMDKDVLIPVDTTILKVAQAGSK